MTSPDSCHETQNVIPVCLDTLFIDGFCNKRHELFGRCISWEEIETPIFQLVPRMRGTS